MTTSVHPSAANNVQATRAASTASGITVSDDDFPAQMTLSQLHARATAPVPR